MLSDICLVKLVTEDEGCRGGGGNQFDRGRNSAGDVVKRKMSVVVSKQGVVAEEADPFDLGTNSIVRDYLYAES